MSKDELEVVYRRHGSLVFRRARAILGSDAEAQEILQELFVSLLEKPEGFRGESSMTTFLYAATTHRALRRIRDRKNRLRLLKDVVAAAAAPNVPPRTDDWVNVRSILKRVPEDLATVAVLRYLDGLSRDEIGECVGCSGRQVGNRLAAFNAMARELLGHEVGVASANDGVGTTESGTGGSPSHQSFAPGPVSSPAVRSATSSSPASTAVSTASEKQ